MQMFTEEELCFAKVDGIGSIAMVKRVRTFDPYDSWFVVDQIEKCDGHRKRTTRTHTELADANGDYKKRLELMKEKARCDEADVDGVTDWGESNHFADVGKMIKCDRCGAYVDQRRNG